VSRVQDGLDLPDETSTSPAPAAETATLDLGSTSKHVLVAHDADGRLVVVGAVFSANAVEKMAAEARDAGLVDVQLGLMFSRAEFHDAVRRASGTFGSRRPETAVGRSMRPTACLDNGSGVQ
jgi:hypothetical protein